MGHYEPFRRNMSFSQHEFRRPVLEVLRQPLEDRTITISRAVGSFSYPASIMMVAASNPCPCGYLGDRKHPCTCSPRQVSKYRAKISGPLLDRMDLHMEVPSVPYEELMNRKDAESSASIRQRVNKAREIQMERFRGEKRVFCNAQMRARHLKKFCLIEGEASKLLETATDRLGLSARAHSRILKVARTIADLSGHEDIGAPQVAEAIQYRSFDRTRIP